jgi:hypothetical protein
MGHLFEVHYAYWKDEALANGQFQSSAEKIGIEIEQQIRTRLREVDCPLPASRTARPPWAKAFEEAGPGRIPIPRSRHELWAQHKLSVLARSPLTYREIGPRIAQPMPRDEEAQLIQELHQILQEPLQDGRLRNALQHMWGYLSDKAPPTEENHTQLQSLYEAVVAQTIAQRPAYLLHSTALSDLGVPLMQQSPPALHKA